MPGSTGPRRTVVLDGTFYSRRHRDDVRAVGLPVILVYLDCPLEVCLRRNRERGDRGIPEQGVRGLHARFEPPSEDERPLVIPTDRVDPDAAAARIREAARRRMHGSGPSGGTERG